QSGGRTYVDVASLAQIANGSVSFNAGRVILNLPGAAAGVPAPAAAPPSQTSAPADPNQLSRAFMKAGIEELALLREWGSPLAYAIRNGYPVTGNWVAG